MSLALSGSVSVTTTLSALPGPLLTTVIVYVIWLDGLYVSASEAFTIPRSAIWIAVVALAMLFEMSGSSTPLATVASLLTTLWSPALTRTTITIVFVAERGDASRRCNVSDVPGRRGLRVRTYHRAPPFTETTVTLFGQEVPDDDVRRGRRTRVMRVERVRDVRARDEWIGRVRLVEAHIGDGDDVDAVTRLVVRVIRIRRGSWRRWRSR